MTINEAIKELLLIREHYALRRGYQNPGDIKLTAFCGDLESGEPVPYFEVFGVIEMDGGDEEFDDTRIAFMLAENGTLE
jgi:hypothetical protein